MTQASISTPYPSSRAWRWLAAIVMIHAVLGVLFGVLVPPLEKLDEFIHWDYVRYLRREGHLPDQRDPYIQENPEEFHQPPLYYIPAALITAPIPFSDPPMTWDPINRYGFAFILTSIPDNANGTLHDPRNLAFPWHGDWLSLYVLRFYSVAISAATLIPMFWLAWAVFEDERLALGTVSWLAFRPSVLSLNSTVSNDPLLLLMGTAVLALCALIIARGPTWRRSIWLGVLLGLTALTKFTWPATAAAVPLAYALAPGFRRDWKRRVSQLAAAGGVALLLVGWWFVRNLILYGDLSGISLGAQATRPDRPQFLPLRAAPPTWEEYGRVGWETFRRYWAHYGVVGMPDWVNVGLVVLTVLLIAGLIYLLASRRLRTLTAHPRAAIFCLLVTLFYLLQIVVLFNMNEHGGQVRYIYAGFAAMAVVSQLGLMGILEAVGARRDSPLRPYFASVLPTAILLPVAVYGLFGVLAPAYDLPRRAADPALLADHYDHPSNVQWMDGNIRLLGFKIEPETIRPGETVFVTLCWQSRGPLDEALPYAVHVIDANNGKIGERTTHPGLGMYATLYWRPGDAFCDRVRVPISSDAPPLETYRIVVSYFHEATLGQVPALLGNGDQQEAVALGEIGVLPDGWPISNQQQAEVVQAADYYRFGSAIGARVDSWAIPGWSVQQQDGYSLGVTWLALADVDRDYQVFVHVLNSSGEVVAQTDTHLLPGFPSRFWPQGARASTMLTVNLSGAAPGAYQVQFGVYDPTTMIRLPVTGFNSHPIINEAVEVGMIEVLP